MKDFVSRLGPAITAFIDYKHALGIKYVTAAVYLHELDDYNYNHGNYDTLIKDVVDGWAKAHAEKSTSGDRSWVSPIRELGRYLINTGDAAAYVLDKSYSIQRYHAEVYLLTESEIQRFFEECDKYVLKHKSPGRPYVLQFLPMMRRSGRNLQ